MGKSQWRCLLQTLVCLGHVALHTAYPRFRRDPETIDFVFYPEENSHLPASAMLTKEGDIMVERRSRIAVRNYYETWINRTIPFRFENLNQQEEDLVIRAMHDIMSKSCVSFMKQSKEMDFITIKKPLSNYGCSSSVGRRGGEQEVILGEGCFLHGIILHELMHALGFWHEHSRPDRDDYIQVVWDNIAQQHHNNFDKYINTSIDTLGTEYDYASIMHYKNNTFAINRSFVTINATRPLPPGVEMGQRVRLSDTDILKIHRLYHCNITHCNNPGVPRSGVLFGVSYEVGRSVSYSCNTGYRLYGSRGRFCDDSGQWTGHLPSCLPEAGLHMCNFDEPVNSLCGWTPDLTANLNWTRYTRSTPSNGTGPSEDHTLGSDQGWYIYLETSGGFNLNESYKARLMSELMSFSPSYAQDKMCFMFYYHMYGQDMGTLRAYLRTLVGPVLNETLIFYRTGQQGDDWNLALVSLDIPPYSQFAIVLEAERGSGYLSDMAVDDVLVAPCSSLSNYLDPGEAADTFKCTFDTDMCGMEQDFRDDFDWQRNRGPTATYQTGPPCDPIFCQTGYYIYIETSNRMGGQKARITTPLLHGGGGRCLLFYWHMEGMSIGRLQVFLRSLEGREVPIWSRSGNQSSSWQFQMLDIVTPPTFFELVFEGTVGINNGLSYRGDIAIDNIELAVGECAEVVRSDCTFQQDLCTWQNDPYAPGTPGRRSWTRHLGRTDTPGTGPVASHNNLTNEYYVYVESSRTFPNDTARLLSGTLSGQVPGYCLQFFCHMFGPDTGTLRVLTCPADAVGYAACRKVWSLVGNQGDRWLRQALYVTSPAVLSFRVVFEVALTGGGRGDIALDDILLHGGQCDTR